MFKRTQSLSNAMCETPALSDYCFWAPYKYSATTTTTTTTNRKSHTRFRLVPKSSTLDDLEWPWTAKTLSVAEKMRLLEPTAQIWMKIDPYYQRQKCRPLILVSGNMRFMGILVGVPLGRGVKWEWGWRRRQFFWPFEWLLLRNLQRYGQQYYMAIGYPLLAGNWLQNEWPWMTLSGYLKSKSVFGQHSVAE